MGCIYLDNNATTPLLSAVWDAMRPYGTEVHGNPASAHQVGRRARRSLEDARGQTAALLGAQADKVLFTSGATEANNLALFGLAADPPGHLITSPLEHPAVAEAIHRLQEIGFVADRLPVSGEGMVLADALPGLLRPETRLLSVMLANNETGALQPIRQLTGLLPESIAFHCDAAQAVGRIPVHFQALGVTSLALSAYKFHGPQGVGALLLRRSARLRPQFYGGHQQRGRRLGTEPVALAVGLATALDLWHREAEARTERVRLLRRLFLERLRQTTTVVLNGPEERGVPHTLNLSFLGCRTDALMMNLDLAGVTCSTGSACSSGSLLPSPVLQAMGVPDERLHSAMRFSLSSLLSDAEVEEAARRVAEVVKWLQTLA